MLNAQMELDYSGMISNTAMSSMASVAGAGPSRRSSPGWTSLGLGYTVETNNNNKSVFMLIMVFSSFVLGAEPLMLLWLLVELFYLQTEPDSVNCLSVV